MKKGLAVPLTMAQIEVANELHQGLPQWKNTDDALHALHNRFPEFDIKATLLKVAAVNQLYPEEEGSDESNRDTRAWWIRDPVLRGVAGPRAGTRRGAGRVRAAGVNHLDLFMSRGLPGIEFPRVPGGDVAGEVVAVGPGVSAPHTGERVIISPVLTCGQCRWCLVGEDNFCPKWRQLGRGVNGGYAELCVVPAVNALPLPQALDFVGAGSLPIVLTTVWHMLVKLARLQLGETVLVWGAGSGVGSMAIQVSKLLGARVLAIAGSDEKVKRAIALGADAVLNHSTQDIPREARRLTEGQGVDVVFEHVGEATWERSLRALRRGGRLVTCGATTGNRGKVNLDALFWNNTQILGNRVGSKGDLLEALGFCTTGQLRLVVDSPYPLVKAVQAHQRLEAREQFGKVVLLP